jgi:hypothetical protein
MAYKQDPKEKRIPLAPEAQFGRCFPCFRFTSCVIVPSPTISALMSSNFLNFLPLIFFLFSATFCCPKHHLTIGSNLNLVKVNFPEDLACSGCPKSYNSMTSWSANSMTQQCKGQKPGIVSFIKLFTAKMFARWSIAVILGTREQINHSVTSSNK